ncbi:mucolipin-3-like [Coccinella septempunctata]|uniref:mucolipin-3-like n=1 Tax=Coccinella septempunctata TaxID=41139 RepID=UPI001D071DCA|nr:mucolipin-3-like [Coccinella septempunctata]
MDPETSQEVRREEYQDISVEDCIHSISTSSLLTEDRLRKRLQFYFMNPIEKWIARRRIPYKFIIQLIKIVLVTLQLSLYSHTRYQHVNYTFDNRVSFCHLFLRGWDPTREINSYPPTAGPLAVYVIEDFYSTIDFAVEGYANVGKAIGTYSYTNEDNSMPDMVFCLYNYKKGDIYGFNESYVFNPEIVETCSNITYDKKDPFKAETYFQNQDIKFSSLVKAVLKFSLKTVNFKSTGRITPPNCYQFDIMITFDNEDHDGQLAISLETQPTRLNCKGDVEYVIEDEIDSILRSLLNYIIISLCAVSLILCVRAIWRAIQLMNVTKEYFLTTFNKPLSTSDRWKFFNLWFLMIIVNDILIIIGSSIQQQIERDEFVSDQWNVCSVFLGTGSLLVWFGVLRYLGFFKTYNVVILTLQKAFPQVVRFLICAVLIYAGFTFCGWLVLGPYHLKFKSLSTTSECLFSLINGDDMFATFSILGTKSELLWWFSRVYLYTFISLYIYIILSLFISVIMDAYETIKEYYEKGFPKSDLLIFIGETNLDDVSNGLYRTRSTDSLGLGLGGLFKYFFCCNRFNKEYRVVPVPKNSETS